jgi:ABC-2 type transport system permease protein
MGRLFCNIRQIFLIAYLSGVLWLQRNPMSIFLSTVSPFSLLFILFVISDGEYVGIAVAGSLVMTMVAFGLALGEDIAYYKLEYKIQDMFISSPVSQMSYMVGLGLSELLFGLPAIVFLIVLTIYFGTSVTLTDLVYIVSSCILTWATCSAIGFLLASHLKHTKNVKQLSSVLTLIIAIFPPVFYSVDVLPLELGYISYAVPTTNASLLIQYSMGLQTPSEWSVSFAIVILVAYTLTFIILARAKSVWRENE